MVQTLPVTGNTEHTKPENRAFYPALDGLRTVAFLMVFGAHYFGLPWGWTGVNVFFVLSGFLITGILFDSRDDPYRARNFYVRRTLRIFPLYYGIFLALLLVQPLAHWHWSLGWIAWPLYVGNFLRFLSPLASVAGTSQQLAADAQVHGHIPGGALYLGHFWSLCVEEQFYLFWPWVVFWIRSRRALLWICGGVVVLDSLARVIAQHSASTWMLASGLLYRFTPFQLDALLLGGLIALLWKGRHRETLLVAGRVLAVVMGIAAVFYVASTIPWHQRFWFVSYPYPTWWLTWGLTFVNFFTAAIILCILRPVGLLYRVLSLRALRWMGRVTYGAYILHDLFHVVFENLYGRATYFLIVHGGQGFNVLSEHQRAIFPVSALALTFGLAWLSFRFFESPFLELKERWTVRNK